MRERGKFILLEGADGAGTTTQARVLKDRIIENDPSAKVEIGHTPSEGDIGKFTRSLITGFKVKDWRIMQNLFNADMIEYTQNTIIPALNDGVHFILDRYYPSTLVYQSSLEPYNFQDAVSRMEHMYDELIGNTMYHADREWGYPLLVPDLTIYLNLPPEVLRQRVLDRGEPLDAYEGHEQRLRLYALYNAWMHSEFDNCNRVNLKGTKSIGKISKECYELFLRTQV